MKKITLLVLMLITAAVRAQNPDPQLFQTWYATFCQGTDMSEAYMVQAIAPPITPTLTINENLEFSGTGACNDFFGTFEISDGDFIQTTSFGATLSLCDPDLHGQFEGSYFGALQSAGNYQITPFQQGLQLIIYTPLMGILIFQNFPLAVPDFKMENLVVYPVPFQGKLNLERKGVVLSGGDVTDVLGKTVFTFEGNPESIDLSTLSNGAYLLRLRSGEKTRTVKIIKQ